MRRFISALCTLLIVVMLCLSVLSVSAASYVLGDVDGDGEVYITDVTWIQRSLAYMDVPATYNKIAADVDGDGGVTITDATWIQRRLAFIPTPYPIGDTIEDATEAPTEAATEAPTEPATQAPTQAPTQKPTSKPDPYELPPI